MAFDGLCELLQGRFPAMQLGSSAEEELAGTAAQERAVSSPFLIRAFMRRRVSSALGPPFALDLS